jgi:hypothetical protein
VSVHEGNQTTEKEVVIPRAVLEQYSSGFSFVILEPMSLTEARTEFGRALDYASIGSIRKYDVDGRELYVIHVSWGQFWTSWEEDGTIKTVDMVTHRKAALEPGECRSVEACRYMEPTGHHSEGFDIIVSI